jgi:hypothetical protein
MTSDDGGGGASGARAATPARRELALAAAVLALAVAATLWRPIAHVRTHTLGSWDYLAQSSSLTRVGERGTYANAQLTDPVRQMLPWSRYAAEEVRSGRVPLWNPLDGCGVPLFANYQSGLLSVFNLPFYVLPLKAAALASAALKLVVAGLAAFAFLRALERSFAASLFGACAYALAGFHLVCIQHPHVGVMALFPAALYCAERALRSIEAGGARARSTLRALAGLSLALALMATAGHPEPLIASGAVLALYCTWRTAGLAARRRAPLGRAASAAAALIGAGALGAALAAVQWLPFLEYYAESELSDVGDRLGPALQVAELPLQVFPLLFGAPMDGDWLTSQAPWPTFQDASSFHAGAIALCFALTAFALREARRRGAFWCLLLLIEIPIVYDVGRTTDLARAVLFESLPAMRLHAPWLIALAALAAHAFDAWRERAASRGLRGLAPLFAAALVFQIGAAVAARESVSALASSLELDPERCWRVAGEHVRHVSVAFGAGFAGAALALAGGSKGMRAAGLALALAAHVATTGFALGHYAPAVEDRFVFPRTDAVERVRAEVGGERVLFLTTDHLTPNVNLAYRLGTVTSYDAVEIGALRELADRSFGIQSYVGATLRASPQALALFGVRYVTARSDWLPIGTQFAIPSSARGDCDPYLRYEAIGAPPGKAGRIAVGREGVRQEFRAEVEGFDGLALRWMSDARGLDARIEAHLVDLDLACTVQVERFTLRDEREVPHRARESVLRFGPIAGSTGRRFALDVRRLDAGGGSPELVRFGAASRPGLAADGDDLDGGAGRFEGWRLFDRGEPTHGRIVLDLSGSTPFTPLARVGEQTLFRHEAGRGRAWIVGAAEIAESHAAALERVLDESFDPYRSVVLEEPHAAAREVAREPAGRVEWVADSPSSIALGTRSAAPGYLVLSHPYFTGWVARVDGERAPLLRANYAFSAVELPAGEHRVELAYEPRSVRIGLAITAAALFAWLALALRARRATV